MKRALLNFASVILLSTLLLGCSRSDSSKDGKTATNGGTTNTTGTSTTNTANGAYTSARPGMLAYLTTPPTAQTGTEGTVVKFDQIVEKRGPGSDKAFDTDSGNYTVQVNGLYTIQVSITFPGGYVSGSNNNQYCGTMIMESAAPVAIAHGYSTWATAQPCTAHASVTRSLSKGAVIQIRALASVATNGGSAGKHAYATFSMACLDCE